MNTPVNQTSDELHHLNDVVRAIVSINGGTRMREVQLIEKNELPRSYNIFDPNDYDWIGKTADGYICRVDEDYIWDNYTHEWHREMSAKVERDGSKVTTDERTPNVSKTSKKKLIQEHLEGGK